MLTAGTEAARERREALLSELLALDARLGAIARALVETGSPHSGSRMIEARRIVGSVAVDVLEGR